MTAPSLAIFKFKGKEEQEEKEKDEQEEKCSKTVFKNRKSANTQI